MSINNITRTNTVDEWRIQTNQSAAELNTIETGNYNKTAGTLSVTGAANVILSGTGTALQVSNTALFQTQVVVGNEISLGQQSTATGNLGVGGVTSLYGPGTALYVANNITSNGNVTVKNTIVANNITVNSNTVIVGTANIGYLGVANTGVFGKAVTVGTTLDVTGNTTSGNLTTSNATETGTLRVGTLATIGNTIVVAANTITGNLTANNNVVAINSVIADNGTITNNLSASYVTANVVGDNIRIAANGTFGETTATTINATNARISANANVAHLTASGSLVADNARITANATASHVIVTGSLVADSARITANATFGETTATTINTTNARISGNANVAHLTSSGSLVADNARITANATAAYVLANVVGNNIAITANGTFGETTATTINTTNARISANANVAHLTASGSLVADNARIAANLTASYVVANVNGNNIAITANGSFGETTATTINATNARISGNANAVNFTASSSVVTPASRITGTTDSTSNTTGAIIVDGGLAVAKSIYTTGGASFIKPNAATTVMIGDSSITNNSAGNLVVGSANVANGGAQGQLTVYGNETVTGNLTAGNVNTSGMVYAGTLRTTGRADFGGTLTAAATTLSSASITGSLTVGGDFTIVGQTLFDTNVIKLRSTTKESGSGYDYLTVNRVNAPIILDGNNDFINQSSHGYTAGQNVSFTLLSTGIATIANNTTYRVLNANTNYFQVANTATPGVPINFIGSGTGVATDLDNRDAQVRWDETNKQWQLRDVTNTSDTTAYSKILTANLITDSTSTSSSSLLASATAVKTTYDAIGTANTNMKNYVDVKETTSQANVGLGLISVTTAYQANVGNGLIIAANTSQANVGAGLISYQTTSQANVGAGLLAYQTTSQANVGLALINAKSYTDTANTNLKNYTDTTISTANTNVVRYVDTQVTANVLNSGAAIVLAQNFSATITDTDPGNGKFQLNNSTVGSATILYLDFLDTYGANVAPTILSFADSTNTTKGHVRLSTFGKSTANNALFAVTNVTGGTGYYKVAGTYVNGTGTFNANDLVMMQFNRAGNVGAQGVVGAQGSVGAQGPQGFQGIGYEGITSTNNLTPASSGNITFTTNQQGAFVSGSRVRVYNTASNYFEGTVTITTGTSWSVAADYSVGTTAATSWAITSVGVRGAQGFTGPTGSTGGTGPQGPQGVAGAQGVQGAQGASGAQGPQGGFSTNSDAQVNSLGLGVAASGVQGSITATGLISTTGGIKANVRTISANTSLTSNSFGALVECTASGVYIDLPTTHSTNNGARIVVYNSSNGDIYVRNGGTGLGGLYASGTTQITVKLSNIVEFVSNGTTWVTINSPNYYDSRVYRRLMIGSTDISLIPNDGYIYAANNIVSGGVITGKQLTVNTPGGIGTLNLYGQTTSAYTFVYNSGTGSSDQTVTFAHSANGVLGNFDNTGNFTATLNITAYSDKRLKTNIQKIDNALDKVGQLNGYTFDRTDKKDEPRQTGVIAQEVLEVLPEAVLGSEETTYSVAYGNMMGLMIEAIKELKAEIDILKNK